MGKGVGDALGAAKGKGKGKKIGAGTPTAQAARLATMKGVKVPCLEPECKFEVTHSSQGLRNRPNAFPSHFATHPKCRSFYKTAIEDATHSHHHKAKPASKWIFSKIDGKFDDVAFKVWNSKLTAKTVGQVASAKRKKAPKKTRASTNNAT